MSIWVIEWRRKPGVAWRKRSCHLSHSDAVEVFAMIFNPSGYEFRVMEYVRKPQIEDKCSTHQTA